MNLEFFIEVDRFKRMLYCNIGFKKSCNEGEYVIGEGNSFFNCKLIVVVFCCDGKFGRFFFISWMVNLKRKVFLKFMKYFKF